MRSIELLANRLRAGRASSDRTHHLALVIEGGGMRGVVAGGMVTALEELGALECFDSIHGSSAGACAGAYFAAKQAHLGTRIFFEDINNSKFINPLRPAIGRPILESKYLIDYVMRVVKPLDTSAILNRPGYLNIVVTDVDHCAPATFSNFRTPEEFFDVLRATITMPVIAGKSVAIDGCHYFDGGMTQQVAIDSAVSVGATHIVVLLTRREGELERKRKEAKTLSPDLIFLSHFYSQKVADLYSTRNSRINEELAIAARGIASNGASIDVITRPFSSTPIERLTLSGSALRAAADEARRAVFSAVAKASSNLIPEHFSHRDVFAA